MSGKRDQEPRVHLRSYGSAACGDSAHTPAHLTDDLAAVTCGNCRRGYIYRQTAMKAAGKVR